jgi:hypothetical protein
MDRFARTSGSRRLALSGVALLTALLVACEPGGDSGQGTANSSLPPLVSISLQPHPDHGIVAFTPAAEGLPGDSPRWLYRAPPGSEVRQLSVAADGSRLVYAWVPAPDDDIKLLDRSALYLADLTADEWAARHLVGGAHAGEFFLEPALSPDGRFCYYVHVASSEDYLTGYTSVTLRRLDVESGVSTDVIGNGIWPTVSPDGERIAFVGVQPQSQQRGLFMARADGSELRMLVQVGRFFDVDAPVFSPNGEWLYFAVAENDTRDPATLSSTWWERLLPVAPARAHNDHDVPSDWWRVRVDGTGLQRVTEVDQIMTYGAFVPGRGNDFVFATTDGFYQLAGEDGGVRRLGVDGSWMSIGWMRQP